MSQQAVLILLGDWRALVILNLKTEWKPLVGASFLKSSFLFPSNVFNRHSHTNKRMIRIFSQKKRIEIYGFFGIFEKQDLHNVASTNGKTCLHKPCTRQDYWAWYPWVCGQLQGLSPPFYVAVGWGEDQWLTGQYEDGSMCQLCLLEDLPIDTLTCSLSKPFCHLGCLVRTWSFQQNHSVSE